MDALKIASVVGCRPNFIKIAPVMAALERRSRVEAVLVHTGQHYSAGLSDIFFDELGIRRPDVHLEVESGSHARQTASLLTALEGAFRQQVPDLVLVVGDVNSTMAAALAAVKLGIPVAHVEAGLRSFDREMPEEINRVLTDAMADLLFASELAGVENLRREGKPREAIHFVGNVMIDTLKQQEERIDEQRILAELGLEKGAYALVTLHRPANVDDPETLARLIDVLGRLQQRLRVVFPMHLRTQRSVREMNLWQPLESLDGVDIVEPLGYLPFVRLMRDARLVLTDSGGVQEETTCLGVPCLTLRDSTERPVTVVEGTNELVGTDPDRILAAAAAVLDGGGKPGRVPDKWDGQAAERIADILVEKSDTIRGLYPALKQRELEPRKVAS